MLAGAVLGTAPAFAHAVLLSTVPGDRAALTESPAEITLRFNEPVQTVFVRLLDISGRVMVEVPAGTTDSLLRLRPAAAMPAGQYLVSYRVVSDDAHPVAGTLVFAVGAAPQEWATAAASVNAPMWQRFAAANRALYFLALSLAGGATLFLLLMRGDAATLRAALRPTFRVSATLGLATAALAIPIQGGIAVDAIPAAFLTSELWRAGMDTTQGRASVAAILLLVATWRVGWSVGARAVFAPALLAVLLLTTLALTGHVVTAASHWITVPILLAHALPAMLWIGSFAPLLASLNGTNGGGAVTAFARIAPLPLLVLAAAGGAVAFLQVQTLGGLTGTAYGNTLILKSALVAVLLGLAAINRWRLTPLLLGGDAGPLRRSIGLELAVGALVLAVTASLAQTPPPRSLRDAAPSAAAEHDHEGAAEEAYAVGMVAQGKTAILSVSPARSGRNTVTVALRGSGWTGIEPLQVSAVFSLPAAGVEAIVRPMPRIGSGVYEVVGGDMAIAGEWTVKIDVLINDFEKVTFSAPIPVR